MDRVSSDDFVLLPDTGMRLRTHMALQLMAAVISCSPRGVNIENGELSLLANTAVRAADVLIARLNKETT